jgi:hypothetical protein
LILIHQARMIIILNDKEEKYIYSDIQEITELFINFDQKSHKYKPAIKRRD